MSKLGALHLTKHTGAKHSATVIFFHGSGSNGADMKEWVRLMVKNFSFPHIKVMYPTAPLQPYYPAGGSMSNVWFDRAGISQAVPEKLESLAKIEVEVRNLIKQENDGGIPTNRIIVGKYYFNNGTMGGPDAISTRQPLDGQDRPMQLMGSGYVEADVVKEVLGGFSMGGALSFHTAYRWERSVAGTFCFSSFLNNKSIVYEDLKNAAGVSLPPLLQIHGDNDDMVDISWGQNTFKELKALGVPGEFHIMPRLGHSINKRGMHLIKDFIEKHLPEI